MAALAHFRGGAYRLGHQHHHFAPIFTPASWLQHTVRPHTVATYQYVGIAESGVEGAHEEGQPLHSQRQHRRARAEGEADHDSYSNEGAARSSRRRDLFALLFAGRRFGGNNSNNRVFGGALGALASMVLLSPSQEQPGADAHAQAQAHFQPEGASAGVAAAAEAAAHAAYKFAPQPADIPRAATPPFGAPDKYKSFLPDLGQFQAAAPVVEFGVAAACGYVAGYAARFLTRVGVFLVVGSSLGLYALQKQGIIVVQMDRIYAIGREVVRENKGMVDEALEKGNRALSGRLQQLVELLTATTHGIGFSAGFLLAFK